MTGHFVPPRRPSWAALIIAAALAALAAVMSVGCLRLKQDGGYGGVGPANVPRLVAIGLLVLSAATVYAGIRGDVPRARVRSRRRYCGSWAGLWRNLCCCIRRALPLQAGFCLASRRVPWGKSHCG